MIETAERNQSSNRLFLILGALWLILGSVILWQLRSSSTTFIRVKWETETETDTAGFNIYRANAIEDACEGLVPTDYEQINDELIYSEGSAVSGAPYSYIDPDIEANKKYCYQLEDVELSGYTEKHDPPILGKAGGKLDRYLYIVLAPLSFIVGMSLIVQGVRRERSL